MAERKTYAERFTTRCEGTGTAGEATRPAFVLNGVTIGTAYPVRDGSAYCPRCNRTIHLRNDGTMKAHKRRA